METNFMHAFLAVVCTSICMAAKISNNEPHFENEFSHKFIKHFQENHRKEGRVPLFPPGFLPDPLTIADNLYEFDIELLSGSLKHEDASLVGLSSLINDLQMGVKWNNELLVLLNFSASIDYVSLSALHEANITLDLAALGLPIVFEINGEGDIDIGVSNLTLGLELVLSVVNGSIVVEAESMSLGMTRLYIDAVNFTILMGNDELDYNAHLLELLELFMPSLMPLLQPTIGSLLTGLLVECSLTDLLGFDLSCSELFPAQPTTPTTTTDRHTPPPDHGTGSQFLSSNVLVTFVILLFTAYH